MTDLVTTGAILLAGDMTDGDDILLLSGDMTDGDDALTNDIETIFPNRIALGAVRREDWNTRIVTRDDGREFRNNRWGSPLRSYEISMPPMKRDDDDYLALKDLFTTARGSRYSFIFQDWTDDESVVVRFDTSLPLTALTPSIDHPSQISLIEVREYPFESEVILDPPEIIAIGSHAVNGGGTLAVAYPTTDVEGDAFSPAADDIAVIQITAFEALVAATVSTPAGWGVINNGLANSDSRRSHYLFWKRLSGGESGSVNVSPSFGSSPFNSANARMTVIRGCVASGDPFDMSATSTAGNDTTPNGPAINAYGKNRLLLAFWGIQFPGAGFTPDVLFAEEYSDFDSTGIDTMIALHSRTVRLPVTYPGEAATIGGDLSMGQSCIGVSFKP